MSWPGSMFTERGMFSSPALFYPFSFNPNLIFELFRSYVYCSFLLNSLVTGDENNKVGDLIVFTSVIISDLVMKTSARTSCLTPGTLLLRHHFLSVPVDPTDVVHLSGE